MVARDAQPRPEAAPSPDAEDAALLREREVAAFRRARIQDFAVVVPAIGAFALLSPVVRAFAQPVEIVGAPLIVAYIFGVWFALIVGAAFLASRMRAAEAPAAPRDARAPAASDENAP